MVFTHRKCGYAAVDPALIDVKAKRPAVKAGAPIPVYGWDLSKSYSKP
jgi:hypothetical protein